MPAAMIASMHAEGYVDVARLAALKNAEALAAAIDALGEPPDRIAATLRTHHIASAHRSIVPHNPPDSHRFTTLSIGCGSSRF